MRYNEQTSQQFMFFSTNLSKICAKIYRLIYYIKEWEQRKYSEILWISYEWIKWKKRLKNNKNLKLNLMIVFIARNNSMMEFTLFSVKYMFYE